MINYILNTIDIVKTYIIEFIVVTFYETQHLIIFNMIFKKFQNQIVHELKLRKHFIN